MNLFKWFNSNKSADTKKIVSSVNERTISKAYHDLSQEINSLRQYDRGEKKIDAPDIKRAVQRVRKTV